MPFHQRACSGKTRPVLPNQLLGPEIPRKGKGEVKTQEEMSLPFEVQHQPGEGLPVRLTPSSLPPFPPGSGVAGECVGWQAGTGQVQGCTSRQNQARPRWRSANPTDWGICCVPGTVPGSGVIVEDKSDPGPAFMELTL